MVDKQPNIVFVLADNLGWGDWSCYGGSPPTPRIDQLVADGNRFANHCVVAAQVDSHGVGGDVDGDDLAGVDAAQGDLLPGDHHHADVAGYPLDGDRLGRWAGRRPGGAGAAELAGLVPGQRAGQVWRRRAPGSGITGARSRR